MKFGIAKLPKTFYKNTEKKFKRNKTKSLLQWKSLLRWKKNFFTMEQIFVTMEEKLLSLGKFSAVATGARGFLEHHVTTRKRNNNI